MYKKKEIERTISWVKEKKKVLQTIHPILHYTLSSIACKHDLELFLPCTDWELPCIQYELLLWSQNASTCTMAAISASWTLQLPLLLQCAHICMREVAIEMKQSPVTKQSKKGVQRLESMLLTIYSSVSLLFFPDPDFQAKMICSLSLLPLARKKTMILQMICDVSDFIVLYVQKSSCPRTFYEICTIKF
jgi:hypothetical protein